MNYEGCVQDVRGLWGMYRDCVGFMRDVHRELEVYGGCIQSVWGGVWGMYTGCWQSLGDVHRVLVVYGGCIQCSNQIKSNQIKFYLKSAMYI